jgi:hypothetical protein
MNGRELRDLQIEHAAEYYRDTIGGRVVILFWLLPGGLYGCGSASGMGRVYLVHFLFWFGLMLYGMPSLSWYGICWLGGMAHFWLSWFSWRRKVQLDPPEENQPEEGQTLTVTINL